MTATFGLRRLVIRPIMNSLRGLSGASRRTWKGERAAGADRLPGEPEQIERAAKAQRVVGVGHGEDQRGDAEGRAEDVEDEAERDAAERDQAGDGPCESEREIR